MIQSKYPKEKIGRIEVKQRMIQETNEEVTKDQDKVQQNLKPLENQPRDQPLADLAVTSADTLHPLDRFYTLLFVSIHTVLGLLYNWLLIVFLPGFFTFQHPETRNIANVSDVAVDGCEGHKEQKECHLHGKEGKPRIHGKPMLKEWLQEKKEGRMHEGGENSGIMVPPQKRITVRLPLSENRWSRWSLNGARELSGDSPVVVDLRVRGLLNKLHLANFDSISDQLITWANKSEKEKDGRTMIQVIRQVFEKAVDEEMWSETYGRLCRKMMEHISPQVQDEEIRNTNGDPASGGQLFRKYLLNRCQEDFECGWGVKDAVSAIAIAKVDEQEGALQAKSKHADDADCEPVLYSDEYYAIQKARRRRLGLIRFLGELFKLQILTERIMHECVKKLLGNVENPEVEEFESLCKLLTTIGQILDTNKARALMDVYFSRMKELTRNESVNPRLQLLLLVRMF
jgi:MIF4G domain